MTAFEKIEFSFHDQSDGRHVVMFFNRNRLPNVTLSFIDPERPDETNAQERERLRKLAEPLLQAAIDSL